MQQSPIPGVGPATAPAKQIVHTAAGPVECDADEANDYMSVNMGMAANMPAVTKQLSIGGEMHQVSPKVAKAHAKMHGGY